MQIDEVVVSACPSLGAALPQDRLSTNGVEYWVSVEGQLAELGSNIKDRAGTAHERSAPSGK